MDPLRWRRAWMAFCVAHLGKSLLWAASDILTLYLLIGRYGIAPAAAGGLFLAGLLASAIADLIVGSWLTKRPGDAPAVAAIGLFVAGMSFPLTIVLAPWGPSALLAATLIFRIAYAGCDVPHNALMSSLTRDPARVTSLSRGRTIGTGVSSLIIAAGLDILARASVEPFLWALGLAAVLLGAAMVPLIRNFPSATEGRRADNSLTALPWRFLIASVVGMVALGSLGKALLHLPDAQLAIPASTMVIWLIIGRAASAFLPVRITSVRDGFGLLALTFAASATAPILFLGHHLSMAAPLILGLAMGSSNMIAWALVSLLSRDARDYGLYTMVSKVALGGAGLALAGGLGAAPAFTEVGFPAFASAVAIAALWAALLSLTCRRRLELGAV